MKERIGLCGKEFEIIRSPRRKRIAIGINPSGGWFIGVPDRYTKESLLKILTEDKELPALVEKLEKKAVEVVPAKNYSEGEELFFQGKSFPLRWDCVSDAQPVELRDGALYISAKRRGREAESLEIWYSRQLYYILRETLPRWTKKIGVAPKKISIKKVKTLWGSCSAKGSLTFSARLALVPPRLLEYVVVHELVHMKHMDHSDRFWAEVERNLPDYKERRDELKKNGARYKW